MFVLDLYIMYDVYTWLVGDMEQVPRRVNGLSYPCTINFWRLGIFFGMPFSLLEVDRGNPLCCARLIVQPMLIWQLLGIELNLAKCMGCMGIFTMTTPWPFFHFHKLIVLYTHRIYTFMTWFFFMGSICLSKIPVSWILYGYIYNQQLSQVPVLGWSQSRFITDADAGRFPIQGFDINQYHGNW